MGSLTKQEVQDDFLKAREWIVAKGFDAPNFLAYSVYGEELTLIHKISEFFGTPDAPVTEGVYRVWEHAIEGMDGQWIPETVYSGNPELVFVTRLQEALTPVERQSIWAHAFMHIYQETKCGMKGNSERGARMNEIDRTIKYGIDHMRSSYNATQNWKVQSWQDYIAILNLMAASEIKIPNEMRKVSDKPDLTDLYEMYDLLCEKYELKQQRSLSVIMAEGTATDIEKQFMDDQHEPLSLLKAMPPQYVFGWKLSEAIRKSQGETVWLELLKTCTNDHDYLKRAEKYVDLDAVLKEAKMTFLQDQLNATPDEIQRLFPEKSPSPKSKKGKKTTDETEPMCVNNRCEQYFNSFITEYYNKVRAGAKTVGEFTTKPVDILYLDPDLCVISSDNYYLSDEELLVLSKYISTDDMYPQYPSMVRVRQGNLSYVVGMKQAQIAKEIKTPYDLKGENKSWTLHLPVGLVPKDKDKPVTPNPYALNVMKALEGKLDKDTSDKLGIVKVAKGKLDADTLKTVGQAITWIKSGG